MERDRDLIGSFNDIVSRKPRCGFWKRHDRRKRSTEHRFAIGRWCIGEADWRQARLRPREDADLHVAQARETA